MTASAQRVLSQLTGSVHSLSTTAPPQQRAPRQSPSRYAAVAPGEAAIASTVLPIPPAPLATHAHGRAGGTPKRVGRAHALDCTESAGVAWGLTRAQQRTAVDEADGGCADAVAAAGLPVHLHGGVHLGAGVVPGAGATVCTRHHMPCRRQRARRSIDGGRVGFWCIPGWELWGRRGAQSKRRTVWFEAWREVPLGVIRLAARRH